MEQTNRKRKNACAGLTRRQILKGTASGLALTSAVGIAPRFLFPRSAHAAGLAPGMTGGPSGFAGAERYQYNEGMSEGRAIEGIKKLKAAGKAPEKLVILLTEGAIGQLNRPYPAGAPTVQQVWERESGVKLEIIGAPPAEMFTKVIQDVTTGAGEFDIYTHAWNNVGDIVEAKGIVNLDEFVDKYKPDFDDPQRGYTGGKQGVELLDKYAGSHYMVSLDGDFQTWIYRTDLFEDPAERKAFKARYGYDLAPPRTWEELDQIAAFFHRPDKGLIGSTDLRNQGWGYTNWYQRYASMAVPDQFLFDLDGNPLLDSEAGVKATQEYVDSLKYHSKDAISWGWPEQYGNMAKGGAAITCAFSNMPKFLDTPKSKVGGKMGAFLPPGRVHGGKLVRRSVLWYNINATVARRSKHPEAAYLFLQWLGSTRTFSWMTGNPAGYFDPFQLANFSDPLVIQSYHGYQVKNIQQTIKRAVPSINFAGVGALHNALDENLMAALIGKISPAEAMTNTAKAWRKIIRKKGKERMVNAIRKNRAAWPTTLDTA